MKRILLGTTALVGVVLASQAALADGPKVTVGGDSEFEAGLVNGNNTGAKEAPSGSAMDHGFYTRNEVSFKVDGKSDAGLGYGGEVWLQADTSGSQNAQGVNATRTFIYMDGMWGRVEGGSNYGADETLKVDASTIARATGGIAGDWQYFAGNVAHANAFISSPDLPLNYGFSNTAAGLGSGCAQQDPGLQNDCTKNIDKLTYYTPKWNGLQAGLSYAANNLNRGQIVNLTNAGGASTNGSNSFAGGTDAVKVSDVRNIWQGGLNWNGQWDQIGITLGGTAERGDAESASFADLWAWQLGGKLSYMGFSVAGSYADWGDSLRRTGISASNDRNWTLGGAYEYGPYGVSVTYLASNLDGGVGANKDFASSDKFHNLVVGTDYKLAPGLTPYAELSFFNENAQAAGPLNDNHGHVFLLGTQLNF